MTDIELSSRASNGGISNWLRSTSSVTVSPNSLAPTSAPANCLSFQFAGGAGAAGFRLNSTKPTTSSNKPPPATNMAFCRV